MRVLVGDNLNQSSSVPCSPKNQSCPEVHQAQGCQPGEGGSCPALLCAGAALGAGLGTTVSEGHKSTRECPNQSYGDGEGYEGKMYEDQLRSLGLFSPEEAEGRTHGSLQGSKGTALSSALW